MTNYWGSKDMSVPHHANKSVWLGHSGDYVPSPPLRGNQKKLEKVARHWQDHPRSKDGEWLDRAWLETALAVL